MSSGSSSTTSTPHYQQAGSMSWGPPAGLHQNSYEGIGMPPPHVQQPQGPPPPQQQQQPPPPASAAHPPAAQHQPPPHHHYPSYGAPPPAAPAVHAPTPQQQQQQQQQQHAPPPSTSYALPPPDFKPSVAAINDAQKACRTAISALNFEDIPSALKSLHEAIRQLMPRQ